MAHDPTKVVMGGVLTNHRIVEPVPGAPVVEAGLAMKTGDSYDGISLGKHQSGINVTSKCKAGERVPLIIDDGFTPTKGAQVSVSNTTNKGIAAGAGATAVNAIYHDGVVLVGIGEDGNNKRVTLINFVGGL